jgi:hypothetical protein
MNPRRIRLLVTSAALILLSQACKLPVPFAQQLLFTRTRTQLPESEDCRRCHGEVVAEWADSGHASAWTSPRFTSLTVDHSAQPCLGCHAPAPLGSDGEIGLRDDHRAEGVTCVSCHLAPDPSDGLTMRGPHEPTSPVEVHPIAVDALFTRAELCGTCHRRALEQWRAAPEPTDGSAKQVCQDCHMPAVRRTMESYDPARPYSRVFIAMEKPVDGRMHRFSVPADPWKYVRISTARTGVRWSVDVQNDVPHALPTGAFGRRELQLRAGASRIRLRADLDQAIAAGERRRFELAAPADAEVVLERLDPRTERYERIAPEPPAN